MSPERTRGTSDIDGRSDIYSLGALVYALLAGRPPFEGVTLVETIQKIRTADPVKPKKFQLSIPDQFEGTVNLARVVIYESEVTQRAAFAVTVAKLAVDT